MNIKKENEVTLYAKGKTEGKILFWSIWSVERSLVIEHGVLGGETITSTEAVPYGLAGRTLEEQIMSRINSRVNKKKDSGYVTTLEAAEQGDRRNALGYKKAAKCSPYNGIDSMFCHTSYVGIQNKLNGHHASVVNDNGKLVMYSSNGKIIDTMPELLVGLEVPLGATIEGELYHHGTILQTISSWVKRRQPESDLIEFHIYDIDMKESYMERLDVLNKMKKNDRCKIVHTDFVWGIFNVEPLLKTALDKGYEGLVFRLDGFPHEDGVRSKGMIKVKPRHFKNFRIDDEFLVINIFSSVDGWARLQCETETGQKFIVSCHGDVAYKTLVYENRKDYIGKHVRVEFESYTKDKKPFHPVALEWREKFDE